jgi:ubiquinone/menaquinone biosynthesis C-methylase UbiE
MKILDVGCGSNKFKSPDPKDIIIGMDYYNKDTVDVKHDVDKLPYPFKDNEFDIINCSHILEHVSDLIKTMDELHRIAKPGAKIIIRMPHGSVSYAWGHPTHKRLGALHTFDYFTKEAHEKYNKKDFKILKKRLHYARLKWIGYLIDFIVNLSPQTQYLFERFLCYYLGGFGEVYFELEVLK